MLPLPSEVTGPIGRIPCDMVIPLALAELCLSTSVGFNTV
jgi:hypothetical protein